jgi:dolichol-phosphate mannosyltransferase
MKDASDVAVIASPQLSIVVPTFKERENIEPLVKLLDRALWGIVWEVIFVDDDSPDGTSQCVKQLSERDGRVRCIRRVGRRGLAGACVEGILSSSAPVVAVMDADLQHDEALLAKMFAEIQGGADLVVGSRYVEGDSSAAGFSSIRQWGSSAATSLAKRFLSVKLSDPLSGFFMIRREVVENVAGQLANEGFKLLLDIVASVPKQLRTVELPFKFRERKAGESKLDSRVTAEYISLLLSKLSGGLLPVRFLMFLAVGASGVFIHLGSLLTSIHLFHVDFSWAQFAATVIAMTWNFFLNNQLTYWDRRLTGLQLVSGLVTFYCVCSLGTLANVGVACWLYGFGPGEVVAGVAGAVLSSVFNYAASSVLTWRK